MDDYQALIERDPKLLPDYRAVILAPLTAGDTVMGVLTLTADRPSAFSHADLETVQRFAALASVALDNARLLETARRAEERASERNALLETLHQVNLELGDHEQLQPLLHSILERSLSILGGHDGRLYFAEEGGEARLMAHIGGEPVHTVRRGEGASGTVLERGAGLIVEDYRTWSGRYPTQQRGRWRSVVSVPLRRGAQVLGALTVVDTERAGRFIERDLEVLERFAGVASLALEKAKLLEDARLARAAAEERAAQLEALYTASLELSSELEPQRLLSDVLRRAAAFLKADTGGIFLNEPSGTHAALAVGIGGRPPERIALGEGAVGRVALSGEAVLVADSEINPADDPDTQARSLVCVPLQRAGRVVGALAIADTRRANRFKPADLEALERFAALASIALENARLYAGERQSLRDERVRLYITQAIARLRGVTDTAQALVNALALMLDYEHIAIFLRDQDGLRLSAVRGYSQVALTHLQPDQGVTWRVLDSGQAELIADSRAEQTWFSVSEQFTSLVCVPLTNRDGVFGTLNVEGTNARPMRQADFEMLTALAPAFSTALENATLHEQLERKAAELEGLKLAAEHAARHDPLTELRNRRAFEEDLKAAFQRYRTGGAGFALAVLDLAGFKAVNDSLGHAAGDEALRAVARVLRGDADASRVAYRIGGDEFMLLVPAASEARSLLEQVSAGIQALELPLGLRLMPNIGLATCPTDTTDPDRLQSLADKRMYAAKAAGHFISDGEHLPRPQRRASDRRADQTSAEHANAEPSSAGREAS